MSIEKEINDLLRLISVHRFHNPLQPKACELCKTEEYRQKNTPTVRWSKALQTVLRPPTPVGIMLATIFGLICALALTI